MTESTELLAFKRQKDGYKVTVKIFFLPGAQVLRCVFPYPSYIRS